MLDPQSGKPHNFDETFKHLNSTVEVSGFPTFAASAYAVAFDASHFYLLLMSLLLNLIVVDDG